jgi:ABC-type multidrug transport system permease subunit
MEKNNENSNAVKQRHGCVTAWLVLMIFANSLTAVIYLFASDMIIKNLPGNVSTPMLILLGIIGIGNIVFSVLLFQWKKVGFWGFLLTSIASLIINLSIGLGIGQSVIGLVGIAILYGVLQIKKDNVSAWDNLE